MSESGAETPVNTNFTRPASEYTIHRLDNYEQINAPTVGESDQKFNDLTRQLWKELAVHGTYGGIDAKTGKPIVNPKTDLDGKCCIGLLGLARIDASQPSYVPQGEYIKGKVNFDSGNKEGVVVEDNGFTLVIDHHGPESKRGSSATGITYKTLTDLGLITKEPYLDKLVNFVSQVDNLQFPLNETNFMNSNRTVFGLTRYIAFDKLTEYFKQSRDPNEILSYKEIAQYGLTDDSRRHKGKIYTSWQELKQMEQDGRIIPSDRYGKIVVDLDNKVPLGADAAKAYGAGVYIKWVPKDKSFFISSSRPITDTFEQGRRMRETMWITERGKGEPLKQKLGDMLQKLTDSQLQPAGVLKEYLDKETPPIQVVGPKPTFFRRLWEKIRNFRLDI